jgi:8-oxo-dGTP pyrophosphatase MutT (NUDIX family)
MPDRKIHDSEVPTVGKQVITACAFLWCEINGVKKVFLPRRAETKKFLPGVYELPGGHIDFGEDVVTGLKREIREEFGMEIEVGEPFFVFTYLNEIKGSHSIEVVYCAQFLGDIENIKTDPEYHSGYVWVAEYELASLVANREEDDPEIKAIKKGFEKVGSN